MNFKILTVNGTDLSGASHEEAARAFETAAEPITVVLRRNEAAGVEQSRCSAARSNRPTQNGEAACFCRYYMENSDAMQNPMHALIMSELVRFQRDRDFAVPHPSTDHHYDDDNAFLESEISHVDFEEIVLVRPKGNQKLGLTLCDEKDSHIDHTRVIVDYVTPGSLAFKSKKIQEGDQIFEINGVPVENMNHAAQLLSKETSPVIFLIGRPILQTDDRTWQQNCNLGNDVITNRRCSGTSRDLFTGMSCTAPADLQQTNGSLTESSGTTGSKESTNEKDSGVGHTMQSRMQDSLEVVSKTSSEVDESKRKSKYTSAAHDSNTVAKELAYVQPQEYNNKQPKRCHLKASESIDRNRMNGVHSDRNNNDLLSLSKAIKSFRLAKNDQNINLRTRLSSVEEDDYLNQISSPWVQIARQDYKDKMRQIRTDSDVQSTFPIATDQTNSQIATKKSTVISNDANDNTSSAYSTGESFRSSSSICPTVTDQLSKGKKTTNVSDATNASHQGCLTMTYYYSSDANSDGEGPACYLTHCDDSESEGFEDARLEFNTVFHASSCFPNKPVPFPRILHPPKDSTSFMGQSLSASTRNLWRAAAAAARSRRPPAINSKLVEGKENVKESPDKKFNAEKTSASESRVRFDESQTDPNLTTPDTYNNLKVRRSSDLSRSKQTKTQATSQDNVNMEWKVRISRDGTRYITKRPVRERLLRQREKRLLAERCGITTDDDVTDLKLGRHWTRDERKRQLRHAREKKRRREFMQQCRLAVLRENSPADSEIVELRQKKMSKQKQKRMLLDNFVTVQEIVAHGDRTNDIAKINPLLSVTYI